MNFVCFFWRNWRPIHRSFFSSLFLATMATNLIAHCCALAFLMLILWAVRCIVFLLNISVDKYNNFLLFLLLFKNRFLSSPFCCVCAANLCIVTLNQAIYHRHILVFQSSFDRLCVSSPSAPPSTTNKWLSFLLFFQLVLANQWSPNSFVFASMVTRHVKQITENYYLCIYFA